MAPEILTNYLVEPLIPANEADYQYSNKLRESLLQTLVRAAPDNKIEIKHAEADADYDTKGLRFRISVDEEKTTLYFSEPLPDELDPTLLYISYHV